MEDPSRGEFEKLDALGSASIELSLPDVRAFWEPASTWLDEAATLSGLDVDPKAPMGRVLIGNMAKQRSRDGDIKIDRTSKSPLANPFAIREGIASRDEVCEACDEVFSAAGSSARAPDDPSAWQAAAHAEHSAASRRGWAPTYQGDAQARIEALRAIAQRVANGHDVRLMCHCFPKRCHGESVAREVYELATAIRSEAASREARLRGKRRSTGAKPSQP